MGVLARNRGSMTLDEFYEFALSRPDGEKWELIEGEPILSPAPNLVHQRIVANIIYTLRQIEYRIAPAWEVIPGIGVELSKQSVPIPDVMIRPKNDEATWRCDDAIVAFEVLSPSTRKRDRGWKRRAYPTLPTLQHYVIIVQNAAEVTAYDRPSGFAERQVNGLEANLYLSAIDVSLPLAQIYRGTPVADLKPG